MKEELTLVEFLIKSIRIYRRHLKVCLAIVLACTVIGIAYSYQKKNKYQATINGMSKTLRYASIESVAGVFDHHLKLKNYKALAEYLEADEAEVRKLLTSTVSYTKHKIALTQEIHVNFKVVFEVEDTTVYPFLSQWLIKAFEKNELSMARVQAEKETAERNLEIIRASLRELDSIAGRISTYLDEGGVKDGKGILTSPDNLMSNKILLLQSQTQTERFIANAVPVQVINQLNSYEPSQNKWVFALAFVLIGILLSVFYVFVLEITHRVKEV